MTRIPETLSIGCWLVASAVGTFGADLEMPNELFRAPSTTGMEIWQSKPEAKTLPEYRRVAGGGCALEQRFVSVPIQIVFPIRALPCDAIGPCPQEFSNSVSGPLPFDQLESNIGQIKSVKIQGEFVEGGVFVANIASVLPPVPKGHAGVNANIQTAFQLSAPGSLDSVVGHITLNGSDTFDPGEESMQIEFPADFDSPEPLSLPTESISFFQGPGTVELPLTMTFDQEATITNTGIFYQFSVVIQIEAHVTYAFDPLVLGDSTCDGNVDLADWRGMAGCIGGPSTPNSPDECDPLGGQFSDLDRDGDVDLVDVASFVIEFEQ